MKILTIVLLAALFGRAGFGESIELAPFPELSAPRAVTAGGAEGHLAVCWLALLFLYRKNVFFKV